MKKIWSALNSPIADIVGGCICVFFCFFGCYFCGELSFYFFVSFASGFLLAVGLDCLDHGFDRLRKSSGSPDDDKSTQ